MSQNGYTIELPYKGISPLSTTFSLIARLKQALLNGHLMMGVFQSTKNS
ncbi:MULTISPECIES: hypothetical protein [unclassified Vibrio]|nr:MULTISPECIES: hypothetical protein [unclassified Vibrio]